MVGLVVGLVRFAFRCCFFFVTGLLLMGITSTVLAYFPSFNPTSAFAQLDTNAPSEMLSDLRSTLRAALKQDASASPTALLRDATKAINNTLKRNDRDERQKSQR